nr:hypothetical protein [Burkholderia cenocepacia]
MVIVGCNTLCIDLCHTAPRIGEAMDAPRFLTRFALLPIEAISDATTVARLNADAADERPEATLSATTLER